MHEAVTHKYEAGQVAIIVGTYPGAALLAAKAAFRTGAGIVRLFSQEPITPLFPEVIAQPTYSYRPVPILHNKNDKTDHPWVYR